MILVKWKVNKQDDKIAKYLNTFVKRLVEGKIEKEDDKTIQYFYGPL